MSGLGDLAAYERQTGPYSGIVISPWIEELVRQYRRPAPRRRRAWVLVAALLAIAGVFAPWLMRLDAAAYPFEPAKRDALNLCSREDPTFVRFFASARDACYRRVVGRDGLAEAPGDASR